MRIYPSKPLFDPYLSLSFTFCTEYKLFTSASRVSFSGIWSIYHKMRLFLSYGLWFLGSCALLDRHAGGWDGAYTYLYTPSWWKESHSPLAMRRAPAVWHPKRDAPRETGDTCRRSAPAHGYAPVAIHRVALVGAHRQTHPARTCCPYWPGSVWLWAWVGDTS